MRDMLRTSKMIQNWYHANKFRVIIVYGPSGEGKSVFSLKVLKEIYGKSRLRHYIIFRPEDLVKFLMNLQKRNERIPTFLMDDAGLWFNKQDFRDKFVVAAMKWIQVARTNTASIIFTTPNVSQLVKSLRSLDCFLINISNKSPTRSQAKAYNNYVYPSGKSIVNLRWIDTFTPRLEDDIYNYYLKLREGYARNATEMMREALKDHGRDKRRRL